MISIDEITSDLVKGYERATGRPAALITPQEYLLFRKEAKKEAVYTAREGGARNEKSMCHSRDDNERPDSVVDASAQVIKKPATRKRNGNAPIIAERDNRNKKEVQQVQPQAYVDDPSDDDIAGNGLLDMLKGIPG